MAVKKDFILNMEESFNLGIFQAIEKNSSILVIVSL